MLNVGRIENGIVIDHIPAGKSMDIYRYLGLGELDSCVAIIKNAKSDAMGRKDIIKVDGGEDLIDINILGFLRFHIERSNIEMQHKRNRDRKRDGYKKIIRRNTCRMKVS